MPSVDGARQVICWIIKSTRTKEDKKMNKSVYVAMIMLGAGLQAKAQSITYNHDDSKQGQIEVMELGAGNLTPELYYTITHNSYKKGAKSPTSVKNTLRIAANTASLPQVEYADTIQADLESRAKIEAMNVADREVDVAWMTEGSKIEGKLHALKSNISFLSGRTSDDEIDAWNELSSLYDFAIKATKKAYMPNSEREKQYLAIYDEIVSSNDNLLLRIRYLATKNQADKLVATLARFQHRVGENATAGYNRWHDAASSVGGSKKLNNE